MLKVERLRFIAEEGTLGGGRGFGPSRCSVPEPGRPGCVRLAPVLALTFNCEWSCSNERSQVTGDKHALVCLLKRQTRVCLAKVRLLRNK